MKTEIYIPNAVIYLCGRKRIPAKDIPTLYSNYISEQLSDDIVGEKFKTPMPFDVWINDPENLKLM